MFRLVSLNVNGIRSAATKGLVPWAESVSADCMGVQELKVHADDMPPALRTIAGMQGHFHHAEKKGYSGVGIYTRHEPSDVLIGLGTHDVTTQFDAEGRWVELRFDKPGRKLSLISCYFPSGAGLIDVYRRLHPDTTDACYTWWSNRGQARAKNVGWRIDYHLATPALAETARAASIYKDTWFSDHAPLTVDYDFSL